MLFQKDMLFIMPFGNMCLSSTGDAPKRDPLDWATRFKIIMGIARGILYLHEDSRLRLIHMNLKASNILLDEAMNAKISDFVLARLFETGQTEGNTSRIFGT